METKDDHYNPSYDSICNRIYQEMLQLTHHRMGDIPQDHPPRAHLMVVLRTAIWLNLFDTNNPVVTEIVPPYYPPCVRPVEELQPLMISRMRLGTHNRGSRTLVHLVSHACRVVGFTSIIAVVEDEEDMTLLLELHNQPEEDKTIRMHDILQKGEVCIIKDPFLVPCGEGKYILRVDHVSDIILLEDTDSRIPEKWRKPEADLAANSESIRIQGVEQIVQQRVASAERLLTKAIRTAVTSEEREQAYLLRSMARLFLDRPEKALIDVRKGKGDENNPRETSLFREARVLYGLAKYSACLEMFRGIVRSNPIDLTALTWIPRVEKRLSEEESGSYNFKKMHKKAEKYTPPLLDFATYVGSVAIRDSPGKGKGLFTTKPVKVGELLLCEKAFAYAYVEKGDRSKKVIWKDFNTGIASRGGQASLITQIAQKIYHNPTSSKVFTDLYHGDYTPVDVTEVDGAPVVDTFLITKIMQLNSIGAPRTSKASMLQVIKDMNNGDWDEYGELPAYNTCGIWPIASRINHSCVANCRRAFIGDMLILRACRDMDADTELVFSYRIESANQSYEGVQNKLKRWGFACDCALCLDKWATNLLTLLTRQAICGCFTRELKQNASTPRLIEAKALIVSLYETYEASPEATTFPRIEMWYLYIRVGKELVNRDHPVEGLQSLVKGLETLCFIIEAYLPTSADEEKDEMKVVLEIKQWGEVNYHTVVAFYYLMKAYEKLAPELCEVAKGYANTAYTICVGDNSTIGKLYPGLE
ncbi:hypothetical protein F5Y06DRAFT_307938 [Hypoxylon sp. FL0890]|nr:hypothetical protein F5Y06DRAFT_307938 [Hypoxylon sp. FL0890]